MLYFAYGSNLNLRSFKRYAPRAAPVSAATLRGYKMVFRKFCDITPDKKGFVQGALYEITAADERSLDAYEGPNYRKITVTVETPDGPREAMAYMVIEPAAIAPPDLDYYNVVAKGYADWKLDPEPLRQARYATIKR
jgi:gamma-glutamylcyclotransferase (GGCT)/AIG2-like uncharacterized protein YtfP